MVNYKKFSLYQLR